MIKPSAYFYPILLLIALLCFPALLCAEFYRYKDDSGKTCYVDDIAKVPPEYRDQIKSYTEESDHMTPAEKAALEARRERERAYRQMRREQLLEAQRERQKMQQLQNKADAATANDVRGSHGYTAVTIANNQVVVPVQFRFKGKTVTASMLLDTGANRTLINKDVGERLGLKPEDGGMTGIQVVGGGLLPAMDIPVDEIRVGPNKRKNMNVLVLERRAAGGHDGLLGMDFLMGYKFHVDYDKQRLVWSR
ncbi:clan AA aspartic protease, TIGR02281 family [Desulfatibacillum alkenivorans DSM 16219]|jgi:clan AA aspartic protease (TIGR02281 family)|uniref:Clan AA aspartic protease, TIGR02281 family n=1 Tax=Desulfatibacillum alkenivorans DSM 16219 TaxID=1121393 RepID=A0A1M6GL22_9BACT|nr:retropepsin-like aspartic protease [Desulfatibacillum alkenivorans]SHJ10629.1 clan AA aspartic protease, TIGR02281 family [Desulfatibacillum alkenivorans DSM 16219]